MSYRSKITALVLAVALVVPASIASAAEQPDSGQIQNAYAWTNLLETGDLLVAGKYTVSYSSLPDDGIELTFIARLVDSGTLVATNTPYPYFDSDGDGDLDGYGEGIVSIYMTAAETLAQGFTDAAGAWLAWPDPNLTFELNGNPSQFETIPSYSHPLASGDFTSDETRATNQDALGDQVLIWARELQQAWDVSLLVQGSSSLLNDTDGAGYFTLAIPELRRMAPDIFSVKTTIATVPTPVPTGIPTFASASQDRLDVYQLWGQGFNTLADDMGWPRGSVEGFMVLLAVVALIAGAAKKWGTRGAQVALLFSAVFMLPLMMMGTGWIAWQAGAMTVFALGLAAILKQQERLGG